MSQKQQYIQYSQFPTNSNQIQNNSFASSQQNDIDNDEEDYDDDDDDNDEDLMEFFTGAVNEFFEDVISGKQNLSGDDEKWQITKNMSPQLLALFGIKSIDQVSAQRSEVWRPPTKSGLDNSEPIIKTNFNSTPIVNDASSYQKESQMQSNKRIYLKTPPPQYALGRSTPYHFRTYDNSEDREVITRTGGTIQSAEDNSSRDNEYDSEDKDEFDVDDGDGDEEYTESDEDDDDIEEDEDAYANRIVAMMSMNLKNAIGIKTTDKPLESDWKPPSRPGLGNSDRIIK